MKIILIAGGAIHYELGLAAGLVEQGVAVEVVGGTDLKSYPVMAHPQVIFHDLQGSPAPGRPIGEKLLRVMWYYLRLMKLVSGSGAKIVHVQWPYKFVFFDRTLLNLYYKLLGKKIIFTAHNVDGEARDGTATWSSRFSLRFSYRIVDHIIVHTKKMRDELVAGFGIAAGKISVIPHGVMTAVPETALTRDEARKHFGLPPESRVILFFGLITPYKGVEQLVSAVSHLRGKGERFKLIIAGRVKECEQYWRGISGLIEKSGFKNDVITELKHIPDEAVEKYFKAADVLVLPYRSIFQSGVLFLAYRFGLPVIATDVGSLREDIVKGENGLVCRADDPEDMAKTIAIYFESDLFKNLEKRRRQIRDNAMALYSWSNIGRQTRNVYQAVLSN